MAERPVDPAVPERVTEIGDWEPVDPAPHRWAVGIALAAMAAVYILAAVGLGIVVRDSDRRVDIADVIVPDVAGSTEDVAAERLDDTGLIMVVEEQPNELVPPGQVFEQNPIAGAKVELGSPVTVVVSTGPAGLIVPETAGQQEAEAVALLRANGLSAQSVPTPDELIRPGEVMSSTPEAGQRAPGDGVVQLAVSSGPAPRTVPEAAGRRAVDVLAELGRLRLVPGEITEVVDPAVEIGVVISVEPAAGTSVARGSAVDLRVAGPVEPVRVPSVTGLLEATATSAMTSAGLQPSVRRVALPVGDPRDGRVVRQGIPFAAEVPEGTAVEVIVGVAPPPPTTTTVPSTTAPGSTTTVP